jgi:hypothetical protein
MWIGLALMLEERGEHSTAREAYRAALEVRSFLPSLPPSLPPSLLRSISASPTYAL